MSTVGEWKTERLSFIPFQLRIQKKIGLAFNGFEEAQIDFPPSYKFDIASQLYDTR